MKHILGLKCFLRLAPWCAVLISLPLLFCHLDSVPGLSGDEAWSGLRAQKIISGARPVLGMSNYTGSLYHFIVAGFVGVLGYNVAALRIWTAISAVITLFLYHFVIKQLFSSTIAAISILVLVSLPFFTAYGRIAQEAFGLNPILALCAIALLLKASRCRSPRMSSMMHFLSGICLGLGTWNHLIFLCVPAALLTWTFAHYGIRAIKEFSLYMATAGFFLALLPRIMSQITATVSPNLPIPHRGLIGLIQNTLFHLGEWPLLFLRVAHGDVLYLRYAGTVTLPTPNIISILIVISIVMAIKFYYTSSLKNRSAISAYTASCGTLALVLMAISTGNSDRYFMLALYIVPTIVAYPIRAMLRLKRLQNVTLPLLVVWVVFQLYRTELNYFESQLNDHGRTSLYYLGSQPETSNHYIRTEALYQELVDLGAKHILAETFIAWPLLFHDIGRHAFESVSVVDYASDLPPSGNYLPNTYAVAYSDGLCLMNASDYSSFSVLRKTSKFSILRKK